MRAGDAAEAAGQAGLWGRREHAVGESAGGGGGERRGGDGVVPRFERGEEGEEGGEGEGEGREGFEEVERADAPVEDGSGVGFVIGGEGLELSAVGGIGGVAGREGRCPGGY